MLVQCVSIGLKKIIFGEAEGHLTHGIWGFIG